MGLEKIKALTNSSSLADIATDVDVNTLAITGLENSGVDTVSRWWISPEKYGAVGDGVTDDSSYIQAALDAAHTDGGGTVVLKSGTVYAIGTALILYNNTTLIGYGAEIKLISNGIHMIVNQGYIDGVTRNKNIEIIGCTINADYLSGTGIENIRCIFHKVDNLKISKCIFKSTAGKYMVMLADTDGVNISNSRFECDSDGIHMLGKVYNTTIENIYGITGDDTIAYTGSDYAAYAIEEGECKNLYIRNIYSDSERRAVLLSRDEYDMDNVVVENVRQSALGTGIEYGGSNTTGISSNVKFVNCDSRVVVYDGIIDNFEMDGVSGELSVQATSASANRIDIKNCGEVSFDYNYTMTVEQLYISNSIEPINLQGAEINILVISGLKYSASTTMLTLGNVTKCTLNDCLIEGQVEYGIYLLNLAGNIDVMTINNSNILGYTVNSTIMTASNDGDTLLELTYNNCKLRGYNVYVSRNITGYTATHKLKIINCELECKRVISNDYFWNIDLYLFNNTITSTQEMFYFAQAKTLRIFGSDLGQAITFAGTYTKESYADIKSDLSKLNLVVGSKAYNSNSALSCGVGYCICDGTSWKNLFSGLTYTP